jgi:SH3-like domain-containing protein
MKRFILALTVIFAVVFTTSAQTQTPQVQGSWRAEFFNNPFLAAPIAATATYSEINFDWGTGAPQQGVSADNFSAHFFADIYFPQTGTYRFTIQGDDSYQLIIDQQTVLRTFEEGNPVGTRTVDVTLTEGVHAFQLDYREVSGTAFLKLSWASTTATTTAPQGQTATVTAFRLNVRSEPSATATILTKVNSGEVYSVVGRSTDNNWVQINVNGTVGWVSAAFVRLTGTPAQGSTPTTPSASTGPRVSVNLNLRSAPDLGAEVLAIIPRNSGIQVLGRSADSKWLRATFNNITGWVSASFVTGVDVNSLSVQQ